MWLHQNQLLSGLLCLWTGNNIRKINRTVSSVIEVFDLMQLYITITYSNFKIHNCLIFLIISYFKNFILIFIKKSSKMIWVLESPWGVLALCVKLSIWVPYGEHGRRRKASFWELAMLKLRAHDWWTQISLPMAVWMGMPAINSCVWMLDPQGVAFLCVAQVWPVCLRLLLLSTDQDVDLTASSASCLPASTILLTTMIMD